MYNVHVYMYNTSLYSWLTLDRLLIILLLHCLYIICGITPANVHNMRALLTFHNLNTDYFCILLNTHQICTNCVTRLLKYFLPSDHESAQPWHRTDTEAHIFHSYWTPRILHPYATVSVWCFKQRHNQQYRVCIKDTYLCNLFPAAITFGTTEVNVDQSIT